MGQYMADLYSFYLMVINLLLTLITNQEQDIKQTGPLSDLLELIAKQLKEIKRLGVDISVGDLLKKSLNDALVLSANKPNLTGGLKLILKVL